MTLRPTEEILKEFEDLAERLKNCKLNGGHKPSQYGLYNPKDGHVLDFCTDCSIPYERRATAEERIFTHYRIDDEVRELG